MKTFRAYYNEFDPFAAAWLRELIKKNLIAQGDVDERSIKEVKAEDLKGYAQCHFFAGIGVWSHALRQAGWPDDRKVWTGSCPCQPFSAAGRQKGIEDERHLWPEWFRLITESKPDTIFGEQVAKKAGLTWLDIVSTDLESRNYAVGTAVTSAASFGAPHIRQRIYFCGVGNASERGQFQQPIQTQDIERTIRELSANGESALADDTSTRLERAAGASVRRGSGRPSNGGSSSKKLAEKPKRGSFWTRANWLSFSDGKRRPIESGSFPLVNGAPNRVGRLRGYGNALCAPQAQAFIESYLEVISG